MSVKHLTKFETQAAYNAAKSSLELPNVSFIVETNGVTYEPYTEPTPEPPEPHDYVEIASVKWATMNLGATVPADYGHYFQWADISGYSSDEIGSYGQPKIMDDADYKYYNGSTYTKYNSSDNKTVLDASDDAGKVNWRGNWRLPTPQEYQSLINATNCSCEEYYHDDTWSNILRLVDKTNSSKVLIFPTNGYYDYFGTQDFDNDGYYWTNTIKNGDNWFAQVFTFHFDSEYEEEINPYIYNIKRSYGCPIRLVLDE